MLAVRTDAYEQLRTEFSSKKCNCHENKLLSHIPQLEAAVLVKHNSLEHIRPFNLISAIYKLDSLDNTMLDFLMCAIFLRL